MRCMFFCFGGVLFDGCCVLYAVLFAVRCVLFVVWRAM